MEIYWEKRDTRKNPNNQDRYSLNNAERNIEHSIRNNFSKKFG